MINEKVFNKWFNLFILVGMISTVLVVNILKLRTPGVEVGMLLLVTLGAVMGVCTAVLSANGVIWNFLFGVVNVSICAYTNYDSGNMGQFLLHFCYFLPMQFVGIWQWRKRGAKRQEDGSQAAPKALRFSWKLWVIVVVAAVVGTALVYQLLLYLDTVRLGEGATLEKGKILLDAIVMVLNIEGQILLSLCYSDSWYIWNLVNIFSIALWVNRSLAAGEGGYGVVMVIKYSFYLLNSLNGLRIWLKLSK